MGNELGDLGRTQKKIRGTERKQTTALFLLRCAELGLSMEDLESLDIGMVYDMFTERANYSYEWKQLATQDDFDRF
jgi:hypothetical protein